MNTSSPHCSYSFSLTGARVIRHPLLPCHAHAHALHLNLTLCHYRSVLPHRSRREVSPPTLQQRTFSIPPSCICYPQNTVIFVADVLRCLRIQLSWSDVQSLVDCILGLNSGMGGDASVSVVADVLTERTDVVRMIPPVVFSASDETLILDATAFRSGSVDASINLLKEITFGRATNGDGVACPICLDEFEEGCRAISPPCSHLFHGDCIYKWIKKKTYRATCPLCRSQLFKIQKKHRSWGSSSVAGSTA